MTDFDLTQYPETLAAFGDDEQRATVFLDRYAAKDETGAPRETLPDQMWKRVAEAIGETTDEREAFTNLLSDFKFVPGGRILAGAGAEAEVTFYNCYVIPVETRERRKNRRPAIDMVVENPTEHMEFRIPPIEEDAGNDSRGAIFDTIGLMVDIMSRGGGVGINWSVLRPKGAYLKKVNGTSSGPIGWMNVASKAVGEVEQGGSRRGAAMFMLDDWHPDVLRFIEAKYNDPTVITNANVSVCISDEFMQTVEEDGTWVFQFPDTSHPAYNEEWDGDLRGWLDKGYPTVQYGSLPARQMWRRIAECAWGSNDGTKAGGEPGVVFLDRYNKQSTGAGIERIISVNPCGEQGLGAYSVCNLGSMNLEAYIRPRKVNTSYRGKGKNRITVEQIEYEGNTPTGYSFDYDDFVAGVRDAVQFMDNVIDANYYFLPENEAIQKKLRRIGLGVMGLADALAALGMRYGSPEAVEFTEAVYRVMKDAAIRTSRELAAEKGAAPGWDNSMVDQPYIAEFLARNPGARKDIERTGLRNLFLLTQAPTGTTSILAGVNSGIEPMFALTWTRKDRTGTRKVIAPPVRRYYEALRQAPPKDDFGLELDLPDYFVVADQVTVAEHIQMQAAAQRFIDSSVSKTINGPHGHSVEDILDAYTQAYSAGLKGLAYFRDGSGRDQVLYKGDALPDSANDALAKKDEEIDLLKNQMADMADRWMAEKAEYQRPEVLTGRTSKVQTKVGSAYVTVNRDETGSPVEVFIAVGNSGDDVMAMGEALGRLASLALRKGASLGGVANQLEGIGGMTNLAWAKTVPHAVGQALTAENQRGPINVEQGLVKAEDSASEPARVVIEAPEGDIDISDDIKSFELVIGNDIAAPRGEQCPSCHELALVREEGCRKCHSCSFSAC